MILNDKELEALIREEFSAATPDNFDIILERIQSAREQKEREPSKRKHAVSNMMKLAWAAVLFLVLGTGACPVPGSVQCYRSDHGFHLYRGICASDLDGRLLLSE